MKKLLVGMAVCLAVVALPAFASDDDVTITLDYWSPDVGGLSFLGAQDGNCPGPGGCGNIPLGIMSLTDGGDVPAFSVDWNFHGGNGISFSYYNMEEAGPFTEQLSDDYNYFTRLHYNNYFSDHGDWWEGMVAADITNWSIEWTHDMASTATSSWQIAFGVTNVEYMQTDLQYMNNLHDFGNVITERIREYSVNIDSMFDGFGPSVSVSGSQSLGDHGLAFFGDASLAFLVGDSDISYTSFEDPFDLSNFVNPTSMVAGDIDGDGSSDISATMQPDVDFQYNTDGNAFVAEATLGLSYGFDFGLTLRAGYRTALYTNMPTVTLTDDYMIGEMLDTRDVSLDGAFFGASWTF